MPKVKVFVSVLEKVMPVEELLLKGTPGFGKWKGFFPEEAVEHPAKANLNLLHFLIERYTSPHDTVCDPMAGTGSTGLLAALNGRNAVQVELEDRFFGFMEKARDNLEKHTSLSPKGSISNILGDARSLSSLLQDNSDIVLTSPPYSDSISRKGGDTALKYIGKSSKTARQYSENPQNIGNLQQGEVDAVLTSPPYGQAQEGGGIFREGYMRVKDGKIISDLDLPFRHGRPVNPENPDNIDNLPYVEGNIGDLKEETYLEAMLLVYRECFKIVKPGGLCIIIVKAFIRDFKMVDLPYHTWLLLKEAGFKLEKVYKLRLRGAAFFRILYYRKYPSVGQIRHEYVLVVRK